MIATKQKTSVENLHTKASQPFFSGKGDKNFFCHSDQVPHSFFGSASTYSLNGRGILQTSLVVGQVNDPYEKEADAMADKAVQLQADTISFGNGRTKTIQRKCTECNEEDEQKLQSKAEPTGLSSVPPHIESSLDSTKGLGNPISLNTRTQMESIFGANFTNVRLHTDSSAVQMNKDLHAQAFTHDSDIYFNADKYDTNSIRGKHLLAHELTHVVQQNPHYIQRLPDDRHDLTATSLSGDPILEKCFDNELVISTFSNSRGEHVKKLQEGLIHLGIPLTKFGADEKYGTETANGVKDFQEKAGMTGPKEWDGIVGRKTIGLLDRSLRNNNIEKDTDDSKDDFKTFDEKKKESDTACKGKAIDQPCPVPHTVVEKAADDAIAMIDKTIDEQLPPVITKTADYPSIFSRIFRNNDNRDLSATVTEVKDIYIKVKDFISDLKKDKSKVRCATECDGGCRSGSPAYHQALENGNHIITFCPDFSKDKDRILIVIHECHHAAIPGSSDKAYAHTRLFDKLDHTKALLNAASFHVYAAWVDQPGSAPIGPDVKDANLINDKKQKETTDLALAHMNQWFELIPFDTSQTVQGVEEAHVSGSYQQHNASVFMEVVFSKWFGTTPPPTRPNKEDVQKIKAIDERVSTMEKAFEKPFLILETPDASFWERGPGTGIALNQSTLNLDLDHMIIALLQELVHATPNISAESEPLYVGTINDMRNLRRLDPV